MTAITDRVTILRDGRAVARLRTADTDAGEIRTGTLGTPLKRMVVHALGRERVMAVALDFIP